MSAGVHRGPHRDDRRARLRRRVRRAALAAGSAALAVVLLAGMAAFGYVVSTELPPDPAPPQASVLYYRDGRTVLARIGATDRTDVPLASVPQAVRQAFLAAEDRGFHDHAGVSARGVLRALWSNLTAGTGQGASTITQQYVRNAYLTQDRTLDRKAKEAALALRLERRLSKDEILGRYLNTVYFGRGAYGVQSAAQAYFGTTVDRLGASEGAVLAALVKDPYLNDPANDPERARGRWRWILRAMAGAGWLDPAQAEAAAYPVVARRSVTAQAVGGPLGVIADRVEAELRGLGWSAQTVRTGGLQVVTTIDAQAQRAAADAIAAARRRYRGEQRVALVAVDPADGAVRAWYGGTEGRGFFDDAAAPRPPASTFKPVVLAAGLAAGVSVHSVWDGSSPRIFADRHGVPLRNRLDLQCPACPLDRAMVLSLNTPYYALAEKVGPERVRELAVRLGVPGSYGDRRTLVDLPGEPAPGRTRADIALGRYPVSPADLATVYATFAAGGVRAERHLVQQVGQARTPVVRTRVLPAEVAGDVGYALRQVVRHDGEVEGHPAAAKTGTQQWGDTADSQDAWTAGYTGGLAAVTWVGRETPGPVRDGAGRPINGDGMPYAIWRDFLGRALRGRPAVPLPAAALRGDPFTGDARPLPTRPPVPGLGAAVDGAAARLKNPR
ncbi:transglycosylase domain-containing protein [Spirilliplanes yamanashiensis]|uniref:Penicillin-binding protein n=1 Tax=Spirilliplanes yamanashiensis TaxID=42233 RepID=A0A8J3YB76_9ACTN|nr:transglycosylase domain-containing protein [Spirilliplanes yamanashiensis]MDP9818889.1 membrane peptidoglycan carboxypeptidase [Spirilliplanes yamanashiensis]GIJ05343.1 penicillin-binding protein [Spirilliplanes yamanashiensis]